MKIEWRDVPGWEGLYEVSSDGRVRSLHYRNHLKEKALVEVLGYYKVGLYLKPRKELASVHRLVAMAFIHNPDNKPEVNHINGNKLDNRVENLEWVTASENRKHAIKTGLFDPYNQGRCKPVIAFNKRTGEVERYISASDAARQLGMDASEVSRAANTNSKGRGKYYFVYEEETNGTKIS